MTTPTTFNGGSYIIPSVGDAGWGLNVSTFLLAIPQGALQKTGGAFSLSQADVQFGSSYGLQAIYLKSNSASIAQSGVLRLAQADTVAWRNQANSADLSLSVNSSGQLLWNGSVLATVAAGLVPPTEGGTGVNNGGTLTWGSSNLAFTLTGGTTVTLPTSGTLATLAGSETLSNKTLVAPALGTPVSGNLANCTGLPNSGTTATSAATASTIVARDANVNVALNNLNEAFQTTVTAAGTTTLTVASAPLQQFTGTTTQNLQLPAATTLPTGCQFYVFNRSTGAVTVKDGSGSTIQTLSGGMQGCFTCAANGTAAGTWDLNATYTGTLPVSLGGTGTTTSTGSGSVVLGTSPTLTTPSQASYEDWTQTTTPANPSSGHDRLYFKSDDNLYSLTSAGIEKQIGAGAGGSGQKNYVSTTASNTAATWTAFGTVAATTDTTAADLPRATTTGSGWKLTPSGSTSGTFTVTLATPGVFTATAHGMQTGYPVTFSTTGALPTGLVAGTVYYVNVVSSSTFNVATTMANLIAGTYVATSGSQSGTQSFTFGGAYLRFTLDAADYNVKQQLQWAQNILSGATGDWEVDVYSNTASGYTGTYTRLPLSTDSTGSTTLPNLEGTFRTTFDAPGSAQQYIEIRFLKLAANTHALVGSDLISGPGTTVQGAARSPLGNQYTATIYGQTTNPGLGTGAAYVSWERDGDEMILVGTVQSIGGTAGSGEYTIPLPTGYNINYANYGSNSAKNVAIGECIFIAGFTGTGVTYTAAAGAGYTDYIRLAFGANSWSSTNYSLATNQQLTFTARVPISQWAGSGTVNVAQNDVEYAYNTSTSTSASDTTSFGYGPGGAQIQAIAGNISRRVQFQTPFQIGDFPVVEVWSGTAGDPWLPAAGYISGSFPLSYSAQGTIQYGIGVQPVAGNSAQVDVHFGGYAIPSNSTTYASAGTSWASASLSGFYWRVRKVKAGQAVGFGLVVPGISAGLVPAFSTLDQSLSTTGVKVETARSSPSTSDTQNVYSGTYTPTFTNVAGATIGTVYTATWVRVGNTVTVSGRLNVLPASASASTFTVTVPVARSSNFSAGQVGGTAVYARGGLAPVSYAVLDNGTAGGSASSTTVTLYSSVTPSATYASDACSYQFTYTLS